MQNQLIQGYCERLLFGRDFLSMEGWLQSDVFGRADVKLEVRVDGEPLGCVEIGKPAPRSDLEALGAAGFHSILLGPVPSMGRISVHVIAAQAASEIGSVAGENRQPFVPRGHIDEADEDGVRGWVLDPSCWQSARDPNLVLDGIAIPIPLTRPRPDLHYEPQHGQHLGFFLRWEEILMRLRGANPGLSLGAVPYCLALFSSGLEIDRRRNLHLFSGRGYLEKAHDGLLSGWAVDPDYSDMPIQVDLMLDGTRYQSVEATKDREDLRALAIARRGGGFCFPLPTSHPAGASEAEFSVRLSLAGSLLDGSPVKFEGLAPRHRPRTDLAHVLPLSSRPGVTIVVTIHNASEDVARCLAALAANTSLPARLLLIDDASTDPDVSLLLESWRDVPGIEIHHNALNLGYTASANRGIVLAGDDDVVLLNSDTIVASGWLEGLRLAAYSEAAVATVTPLSNNAGAFSVPEIGVENFLPSWFDVDDQARLVRQTSLGLMPAVPTGNGFCLYIRRDAIDRIGLFDEVVFPRGYGEENDFCLRAWRLGLIHLVDDRSYVYHRRGASFGAEREALMKAGRQEIEKRYPDYSALTTMFRDDQDLLAVRWRLRRAQQAALAGAVPPRPRILFVISTLSGGTPQTNADLMAAISDCYEPWLLRCDTRYIELARWTADGLQSVENWPLNRPVPPTVHRSADYDGRVADILTRHGIEMVHIRHIAWHGLGLPAVCRKLGIPVLFSFHDFYTICPTVKLLDDAGRFCGGTCTPGTGRCRPEMWDIDEMPALKHGFVQPWREMMAQMLADCDGFITTSTAARETVISNFPFLAEKDFRIIPHGRDFPETADGSIFEEVDGPLRVLLPGIFSTAKGTGLVEALAECDADGQLELHVLGDPGTIALADNVVLHGRYERDDFARLVGRIRPHVGAVLSIWPETWSHTLSEMWACGLPVIGLDTGAVGARLTESGAGWLLPVDTSPETLYQALLALKRDRFERIQKQEAVRRWQDGPGRNWDTKGMAACYDQMYRDVQNRRRTFKRDVQQVAQSVPIIFALTAKPGTNATASPLVEHIQNRAKRRLIFRDLPARFRWSKGSLVKANAVLVDMQAIADADIPALLAACLESRVPLFVDASAWRADSNEQPSIASIHVAMFRAATTVYARSPEQAEMLEAAGAITALLPETLPLRAWLAGDTRAEATESSSCRILAVAGSQSNWTKLEMLLAPIADGPHPVFAAGPDLVLPKWAAPAADPSQREDYPVHVQKMQAAARCHDLVLICDSDEARGRLRTFEFRILGIPTVNVPAGGADLDHCRLQLQELCADPLARAREAARGMDQARVAGLFRHADEGLDALLLPKIGNARVASTLAVRPAASKTLARSG